MPRRVQVVARDYAFEAPDTLPAGEVSFELENRGPHDHELIIGRLRPGVTGQDIVAAHQRGVPLRQLPQAYLAEGAAGALLAQPGTRSPAISSCALSGGKRTCCSASCVTLWARPSTRYSACSASPTCDEIRMG